MEAAQEPQGPLVAELLERLDSMAASERPSGTVPG